jgi:hypothetical protein
MARRKQVEAVVDDPSEGHPDEHEAMATLFRQRAVAGDGEASMAYALMQLTDAGYAVAFEVSRLANAMAPPVECDCPKCRVLRGELPHDA